MSDTEKFFTLQQILKLRDDVHQTAVEKGWWPSSGYQNMTRDELDEKLFLVTTELAEAFEIYRSRRALTETWAGEGGKPEGFGVEMADAYIRILDLAGALEVSSLSFTRPPHEGRSLSGLMMETTKALSRASNVATAHGIQGGLFANAISDSLFLVEEVCRQSGVDLLSLIETKAAYNKTRPYRHGNKKA